MNNPEDVVCWECKLVHPDMTCAEARQPQPRFLCSECGTQSNPRMIGQWNCCKDHVAMGGNEPYPVEVQEK